MQRPPRIARSFPVMTLLMFVPLVAILGYIAYTRYVAGDSAGDGWKTYRNERFKYEFRYPPDWQVVGGREPQPGDDFVSQSVILSPAPRTTTGSWPVPNVAAFVNFQGDLCGAGGFGGKPIKAGGVRGTESTCYWDTQGGNFDCTPKPQCRELPLTMTRRFEKDGFTYYLFANNHLADASFNGTLLPADTNASQTTQTLRRILESYRFVD